ncbi:hypothetical protein [Engelhardtia mirabilis]|uniref:Uncharacterized protein n=1 Tax=Engelhardtia mirabilis TaxID=2528011 RepID=A0A518BSK1_9BACT|nr:hypothetical protein Pla133_50800 [Planctomycetes bacterium Pla133]QDV04282.1 hypothetical protein Pla86_50770 [Planctomycetes bacterium Pla86]
MNRKIDDPSSRAAHLWAWMGGAVIVVLLTVRVLAVGGDGSALPADEPVVAVTEAELAPIAAPVVRPADTATPRSVVLPRGLVITVEAEGPCVEQSFEVLARADGARWIRVGTCGAGGTVAWAEPRFPCELVAQSASCWGRTCLAQASAVGLAAEPVVISASGGAAVVGRLVALDRASDDCHTARIFYVASVLDDLPESSAALVSMPRSMAGAVEANDSGEFRIDGLVPTTEYRLWGVSEAGVSLGQGVDAVAGGPPVTVELYRLVGARVVPRVADPSLLGPCFHPGRWSYGLGTSDGGGTVSWRHPPLRWIGQGFDFEGAASRFELPILVMTTADSAAVTTIPLTGGPPGFEPVSVDVELTDVRPGAPPPLRYVDFDPLRDGVGTLSVSIPVPGELLNGSQDSSLGRLHLMPLDSRIQGSIVELTVADLPRLELGCVPVGTYRVLFQAAGSRLSSRGRELPIAVVERGQLGEVRIDLEPWGSLELVRTDAAGISHTGQSKLVLERSLALDDAGAAERIRAICDGPPHVFHLIPCGTWHVLSADRRGNIVEQLGEVTIVEGQTVTLRVP